MTQTVDRNPQWVKVFADSNFQKFIALEKVRTKALTDALLYVG
jgi:hypothetical protein